MKVLLEGSPTEIKKFLELSGIEDLLDDLNAGQVDIWNNIHRVEAEMQQLPVKIFDPVYDIVNKRLKNDKKRNRKTGQDLAGENK